MCGVGREFREEHTNFPSERRSARLLSGFASKNWCAPLETTVLVAVSRPSSLSKSLYRGEFPMGQTIVPSEPTLQSIFCSMYNY